MARRHKRMTVKRQVMSSNPTRANEIFKIFNKAALCQGASYQDDEMKTVQLRLIVQISTRGLEIETTTIAFTIKQKKLLKNTKRL